MIFLKFWTKYLRLLETVFKIRMCLILKQGLQMKYF